MRSRASMASWRFVNFVVYGCERCAGPCWSMRQRGRAVSKRMRGDRGVHGHMIPTRSTIGRAKRELRVSDTPHTEEPAARPDSAVRRAPIVTPPDAPDARPLLGASQLATLRRYGAESDVGRGDLLFTDGDQG